MPWWCDHREGNRLTTQPRLATGASCRGKDAALLNKLVALNQHTQNTHRKMSLDLLCQMWLEDVAAAMKDNTTWQGGHAALVLSEHGYYGAGGFLPGVPLECLDT
jgi:hypothetical protein